MRTNIVEALLRSKPYITEPVMQWDKGQKLRFTNAEEYGLPTAFEIHWSNTRHDGEARTAVGENGVVDIYDEYLQTGKNVYGWLVVHTGDNDAERECEVIIPVKKAPRPKCEDPDSDQLNEIESAIVALNNAVDKTTADTEATAADRAAAEAAQAAAEEAQRLAEEAQAGAELAESNAKASEEAAAESERKAGLSEAAAAQSESNAAASESNAATSEANAAISEANAYNSETEAKRAQGYAEDAQDAAEEAQRQAEAARDAAASSERNAATSETNAAASETAAQRSATDAATAQTGAENARDASVTAKDTAEDYANTASNWATGMNLDGTPSSQHIGNNAKHEAEQAKKWANGKDFSGNPVTSTEPQHNDNAEYWKDQAKNEADRANELVGDLAKEDTQQEIKTQTDEAVELLRQIVEAGASSSDLNGYSLSPGVNGAVVMSYTDPDTEETATITMITNTTGIAIADELANMANIWKEAAESV